MVRGHLRSSMVKQEQDMVAILGSIYINLRHMAMAICSNLFIIRHLSISSSLGMLNMVNMVSSSKEHKQLSSQVRQLVENSLDPREITKEVV